MIKNKLYIILLFIFVLLLWIIFPKSITSPHHFDNIFIEYEEQYNDTSTYTSKCNEIEIMMVGVKYGKEGNQKKCKEWIEKRDICISLHPEYKGIVFQGISEICMKKIEN